MCAATAGAKDGDDARMVLEQIRREKGFGIDIPSELTATVEALRGGLRRSLALLSEDLYRDEVHCLSHTQCPQLLCTQCPEPHTVHGSPMHSVQSTPFEPCTVCGAGALPERTASERG